MIDTVPLLLFLFCLLSGLGFLLYGRRRGHSWWEAFQPTALLFGMAGLTGSEVFLTGLTERVVSLGCLIPGFAISINHSRHLIAKRDSRLLVDAGPGTLSRGELAVSRANLADLNNARAKLRRRMTFVGVVGALPLLGIGIRFDHWPSILMGGAMVVAMGVVGRWIAKPIIYTPNPPLESGAESTPQSEVSAEPSLLE